jgi:hypothetical protein
MVAHVASCGIESMCRVLRIALSTWHEHARRKANPDLRSTRAKEDERLSEEVIRVHVKTLAFKARRRPGSSSIARASRSDATVSPG